MKVLDTGESEAEYLKTQITRSKGKYGFCKVSYSHVRRWKGVMERSGAPLEGPILCLGTRNGREVDLFRAVWRSGTMLTLLVGLLEVQRAGWRSLLPVVESIGRSRTEAINDDSVIGVEVNPDAGRQDTWIGSFDHMPAEWGSRFGILYSNSFDQSQDPRRTATEWLRTMKDRAILILGFGDAEPTATDPVGDLSLSDLLELFPGELIYFHRNGSSYHDVIICIEKHSG
jgi:hypothetical protein